LLLFELKREPLRVQVPLEQFLRDGFPTDGDIMPENPRLRAANQAMEFKTELRYEGYGWAEFGEPLIRAGGPTVVTTDELGRTVAKMEVTEVPTSDSLVDGISGLSRDLFKSLDTGSGSCKLRVDCANGQFSASEHVSRNHNINLKKPSASIAFRCYRAQFDAAEVAAKYFRLPIWNFHGELRPAQWTPKTMHPLRLADDNPASPFELFGELGFVEYVSGYKEHIEAQKDGDCNPRVTAMMVGPTGGHATTWNDLRAWFPFDFLNLLGIASGSRVGAPWIEFFDAGGRLARRMHVQLGTTLYQSGQGFLNDVIHRGGLGCLLTCAAKSPEFQKSYLRVATNHLLLGIRDSQALEDKISHFTRALEALAEEYGLGTQYLLEAADDALRSRVKDVLKSARAGISSIAREQEAAGRTDIAASLRKVADRTLSNPANKDRDFGLTVLLLLDRFGLHDAAVVEVYYKSNPRTDGNKWHQILSSYRGLSQHGAAFQFSTGEHSAVEVFRLASHLADIAARIILKQLGYDGEYQHATAKWPDRKTTDWVTPTTPPIELGYGRGAE
jgi:hypothetical protein